MTITATEPAMSVEQSAFLRAILTHPGDDTARLVYADWLQENGQEERAEFIRVQVELTRTPRCGTVWEPGHPKGPVGCRCCDLRRRERELFESHGADWFGPTGCLTRPNERERSAGGEFRVVARGFIESVTCTAAAWLRHADALVWREGQTVECPNPVQGGVILRPGNPLGR